MADRSAVGDGDERRAGVSETAVVAATRVAAGAAIMAIAALGAIINRADEDRERPDETGRAAPSRVAAAILESVLGAERRAAGLLHAAQARMQPVVDAARSNALLKPIDGLRTSGGELADQGLADAERGAEMMLEALDAVVARVVRDVLRHVDVNELLRSVDLNALVERVDIQAVVERIDPNPLVARLDVDAIMRRIDVAGAAQRVLDEVQIGDVIRESTGTLTVETVDALRRRGADADGRLARFVDSILGRRDGRDTAVSVPPAERAGPTSNGSGSA
jgi:hypothetical protein